MEDDQAKTTEPSGSLACKAAIFLFGVGVVLAVNIVVIAVFCFGPGSENFFLAGRGGQLFQGLPQAGGGVSDPAHPCGFSELGKIFELRRPLLLTQPFAKIDPFCRFFLSGPGHDVRE
jgi:hypothetical protein